MSAVVVSSSAMRKLAVPVPAAPPPRFVPEIPSSGPSATVTVSPAPSSMASEAAASVSVAVRDAPAWPVKTTRGLAPPRSWQATPAASAQLSV